MYLRENMSGRANRLAERQEFILRSLQERGEVAVDELCNALDASLATIRRDLDDLERRSLLRRSRGGAVSIAPFFYEPFRHDSSFQDKVSCFSEEKARIARAAAAMVSTGQTVSLSGGTTATEVVRSLKLLTGITIVTNTVNVAMELSSCKGIEVVVTGGQLRGNWFTLVGPLANHAAQMIFVDIMFIGVDGIDSALGLTSTNPQEAEVLRILVQHAKRRVVVADHSKLGCSAKWLLCPTTEIHDLITDGAATDAAIAPFQDLGIHVTRV
jgi:DeoR family transcriptional regulator of aga operon